MCAAVTIECYKMYMYVCVCVAFGYRVCYVLYE